MCLFVVQSRRGAGFISVTPKRSAGEKNAPSVNEDILVGEVKEMQLFKELTKAATPSMVQLVAFLGSQEVVDRLHNGYLLTEEQGAQAQAIFEELVLAVSRRRRELMFPADGSQVNDFDILGYVGQGKLLFVLQTFIRRISAKTRNRNPPGPTHTQICCFVLCMAGCGKCGIGGGSPEARKKTLCGCGPQNITHLKQSFSSTLAITLSSLLMIVPLL